jgi:signal transduction histidine kinase
MAVFFYRESNRELRDARQRVRFVSQVSHELRSPLTNIRLYAELLEDRIRDVDAGALEHIGVIVSESHRLSRLIDNVLTFARHGRGELVLRCSAADLGAVVAEVVDHHRPLLAARGVNVKAELETPLAALFDRDAVAQILGNLLSNVEKYAPDSGDLVVAAFHRGGECVVRVTDLGPGIPPAAQERVFQPFTRLSDRLNEGVSGAGIGLAISRDLAELQGGGLRIVETASGACFELTLPRANLPLGSAPKGVDGI